MVLPISLLLLLVFTNRYLAGALIRWIQRDQPRPRPLLERPSVTIVVPLFNEGRGIYDTIQSLLRQDYPAEQLQITVVDDCSTDDSHAWASKAAAQNPRVTVLKNPANCGKRRSINHAVRRATSDFIVSVDSDVVVDAQAVGRLMRCFSRPDIAAVGGRVLVENANENWLTRMQAIKYYFGYEYLKNIERVFKSVMCLSGCLTAYRRSVLIELEPILENRNMFGVPIKYGEDRFLTRQIVRAGYRTVSTLDALCWTVAPNTLTKYFAQQLRWRRSNIVDFLGGVTHAWRLHPIVGLHYTSLFAMLVTYPWVVAQNVMQGNFWHLTMVHFAVLAVMGVFYHMDTGWLPPAQRVHPVWFMGLALLMPVTYVLYTPLALFTLDSSSWETRGHTGAPPPQPAAGGT